MNISTVNGTAIKEVKAFKYLASKIESSAKNVETRIAKAWSALNSLTTIWKSSLAQNLKRKLFQATVESVLLYGSSIWTLTKALEMKLDGTYTRMLTAVLNTWRDHPTKLQLYGNLPPIASTIRQ